MSGTISLNAFIADIGSGDLKKRVANIMKNFKQDDPRKILIEIVEAPYGSMNDQFFANIAWLKEKGFRFVVDDYDILATKTDDISRELFERIKNSCDRIKLDHHVSRMLLDGDSTALAALASFKKDNPNVHITAEGEHTIGSFILLPRIDAFQFFDNERRGRGNQSLH